MQGDGGQNVRRVRLRASFTYNKGFDLRSHPAPLSLGRCPAENLLIHTPVNA